MYQIIETMGLSLKDVSVCTEFGNNSPQGANTEHSGARGRVREPRHNSNEHPKKEGRPGVKRERRGNRFDAPKTEERKGERWLGHL